MNGDQAQVRSVRSIFLTWEKLRLPYNILLMATVLIMARGNRSLVFGDSAFILFLILRAALANVLFTAGPAVEAYAQWLGLRAYPFVTWALFVCGLLLAATLAAASTLMFGTKVAD